MGIFSFSLDEWWDYLDQDRSVRDKLEVDRRLVGGSEYLASESQTLRNDSN